MQSQFSAESRVTASSIPGMSKVGPGDLPQPRFVKNKMFKTNMRLIYLLTSLKFKVFHTVCYVIWLQM